MKYDTSGIATAELAAHLRETYGLPIVELRFTPKGEEAWSFVDVGGAPHDTRFFVRVQRADGHAGHHLEEVFAAVAALRNECGLGAALAPLPTTDGQFTSRFGPFVVALFPYISGTTAYETAVTESQWRQTAEIIATLHGSGRRCAVPLAARETFDNPFAPAIRQALLRAKSSAPPTSVYQQRLISLLRAEAEDIESTLRRMHDLGRAARQHDPELGMAPTHGDPNLANFLIDEAGSLHLTDWGELALGPRERDLTSFTEVGLIFTEERIASFLRRYLDVAGRVRLHRALFAFYLYRWVVQEIADYTTRILDDGAAPEVAAHAWEELQPYLPTQHAALESGLNATMRVLADLAAEGRIGYDAS